MFRVGNQTRAFDSNEMWCGIIANICSLQLVAFIIPSQDRHPGVKSGRALYTTAIWSAGTGALTRDAGRWREREIFIERKITYIKKRNKTISVAHNNIVIHTDQHLGIIRLMYRLNKLIMIICLILRGLIVWIIQHWSQAEWNQTFLQGGSNFSGDIDIFQDNVK